MYHNSAKDFIDKRSQNQKFASHLTRPMSSFATPPPVLYYENCKYTEKLKEIYSGIFIYLPYRFYN